MNRFLIREDTVIIDNLDLAGAIDSKFGTDILNRLLDGRGRTFISREQFLTFIEEDCLFSLNDMREIVEEFKEDTE